MCTHFKYNRGVTFSGKMYSRLRQVDTPYNYKDASSWGSDEAYWISCETVIISQVEHLLGIKKVLFILDPSLFPLRHEKRWPHQVWIKSGTGIHLFSQTILKCFMKRSCLMDDPGPWVLLRQMFICRNTFFVTVKRFLNWAQTIVVLVSSELMLIWDWGSGEWEVSNRPVFTDARLSEAANFG